MSGNSFTRHILVLMPCGEPHVPPQLLFRRIGIAIGSRKPNEVVSGAARFYIAWESDSPAPFRPSTESGRGGAKPLACDGMVVEGDDGVCEDLVGMASFAGD